VAHTATKHGPEAVLRTPAAAHGTTTPAALAAWRPPLAPVQVAEWIATMEGETARLAALESQVPLSVYVAAVVDELDPARAAAA
jgi:hypothetical protein